METFQSVSVILKKVELILLTAVYLVRKNNFANHSFAGGVLNLSSSNPPKNIKSKMTTIVYETDATIN